MIHLGPVVGIQIQRGALKAPGAGYDPSPLLSVAEAAVGPAGLVGRHDGGWVLDVHGAGHPHGRGGGRRPLSMGFTSHYEAMEARLGGVPLGIGGENLIVQTDRRIVTGDLAGGVVVQTAEGPLELPGARPAAPCREFTSYLLGIPGVASRDEIAAELAFLGDGMRGFLFALGHLRGWRVLRIGDAVMVHEQVPGISRRRGGPAG